MIATVATIVLMAVMVVMIFISRLALVMNTTAMVLVPVVTCQ